MENIGLCGQCSPVISLEIQGHNGETTNPNMRNCIPTFLLLSKGKLGPQTLARKRIKSEERERGSERWRERVRENSEVHTAALMAVRVFY